MNQKLFKPSLNQVLKVMKKKGHVTFTHPTRAYDLNIIGIRARNSKMNIFDDTLCIIFRDAYGKLNIEYFDFTTLAGKHWMLKPLNPKGTIIMLPQQVRGMFKLDYHNKYNPDKKYPALRQVKGAWYVRDNNKDLKHDYEGPGVTKKFFGIFATNLHRAAISGWSKFVEKWSAGCQVVTGLFKKNQTNYERVMQLANFQVNHGWGDTYTYTLLEEQDFD